MSEGVRGEDSMKLQKKKNRTMQLDTPSIPQSENDKSSKYRARNDVFLRSLFWHTSR